MNARDLVARAVEAIASSEDDDGAIADALAADGIDSAHARAAVIFTTLAFGRAALEGAGPEFDRHYSVDGENRLLAEHPLYVEALAAAHLCDKATFQAIAMRSAETNAINAAAHQGSALEDLSLSPPVLEQSWAGGKDLESSARVALLAESAVASAKVAEAFASHGAADLAVSARVFSGVIRPSAISVQLDVAVEHPVLGERFILESAGGIGKGVDEAIADALRRFLAGSLHPIVAALVDESLSAEQIEIEELVGWRAIMGPVLHQMKVPPTLAYADLLDLLLESFCQSEPGAAPHWIRIYTMQGPEGPLGLDVLVDNEPWPAGEQILEAWPWPWEGEVYAVRHFLFLQPVSEP